MRILITNDDGILAPGIAALYNAVADMGQVAVIAPATTQSAMGHAISVLTPMAVEPVHVAGAFHGLSVDGRPADCVKLAMIELLEQRPDFVLSGINAGANTGTNVLYSGTVAGAIEGAFFGVPAIAFSLELSRELNFALAGSIARDLFRSFVAARPAPGTCLNVNIPALDFGMPKGTRCCVQAQVNMQEHYRKIVSESGIATYWLDGRLPDSDGNPASDLSALREGYVAITPLRFDMTDHARLPELAGWAWPGSFGA